MSRASAADDGAPDAADDGVPSAGPTDASSPVPDPAVPQRPRRSVAVGLVAALAGLLFAMNSSLFHDSDDRSPANLVELAQAQAQRLEEGEAEVAELRSQVTALLAADEVEMPAPDGQSDELGIAAGGTPVSGRGIAVELWDASAPADMAASGLHPDDLVVHQQDLEGVINALWAGGAEALMVQDQRITSLSAVRCVGNVLLLHGRHYSPPYRISAIGDPAALEAAVEGSPEVQIYRQYVEQVGLGWSLEHLEEIEMPAYSGANRLEYAQTLGG